MRTINCFAAFFAAALLCVQFEALGQVPDRYVSDSFAAYEASASRRVRDRRNMPFILTHRRVTENAILLVHDLAASPDQLRDVAELFYAEGLNVVTILLSGHGTRPEDLFNVDFEKWNSDLKFGLDVAQQLGDHVVVGGVSVGALLALNARFEYPERVEGLFLFSPILKFASNEAESSCALRNKVPWVESTFWNITFGLRTRKYPENDPTSYKNIATNGICQVTRLLKEIQRHEESRVWPKLPVYLSFSESDEIADVEATKAYAEGQDAEVQKFEKDLGMDRLGFIRKSNALQFQQLSMSVRHFVDLHFSTPTILGGLAR